MNDLKSNSYFLNMKAVGEAWEKDRVERKECRDKIVEIYGWESEEYQNWLAQDKAAVFPFSDGQRKAYFAWSTSVYHNASELECYDLPWEKDAADFVQTLLDAGFTEFVVTDTSTALMEMLHTLAGLGCKVIELCRIARQESHWGGEEVVSVNGIRIGLEPRHE